MRAFGVARPARFWLDDWSVEEVGPINVLHRPGTPVTVRSEDGAVVYAEGKDYAPLQDPNLNPWRDDGEALPLKLLPGGRIRRRRAPARQLVSFDAYLRLAGDRLHGRTGALRDF